MSDCSEERFFFRYLDGKTVALDVDPHTEIHEVKTMLIAKQQQTTQKLQQQDEKNCSCTTSSIGTKVGLTATDVQLLVSSTIGLLYVCLTALAAPVEVLRSSDIFLVSNGKPLSDHARLSDYCLGSTIHVAGRVRGGCFMLSATVFAIICCACLSSFCTCGLSLVVVPFLLPLLFILPLFCL